MLGEDALLPSLEPRPRGGAGADKGWLRRCAPRWRSTRLASPSRRREILANYPQIKELFGRNPLAFLKARHGEEEKLDFKGANVHIITSKEIWNQKIAEANRDGKTMHICSEETSKNVYAMKSLRNQKMLRRGQVEHVKAERSLLAEADSAYIIKLYYSLQEEEFISHHGVPSWW